MDLQSFTKVQSPWWDPSSTREMRGRDPSLRTAALCVQFPSKHSKAAHCYQCMSPKPTISPFPHTGGSQHGTGAALGWFQSCSYLPQTSLSKVLLKQDFGYFCHIISLFFLSVLRKCSGWCLQLWIQTKLWVQASGRAAGASLTDQGRVWPLQEPWGREKKD